MSVLDACQSAAIRLIGEKPTTIFSSDDTFPLEMQNLANEGAKDIARSHDWQALIKTYTMTGDGSTDAFPFPADYDRMLIRSDIYDSSNFAWGLTRLIDLNEFLYVRKGGIAVLPGVWTVFEGKVQFAPAPSSGSTNYFPYISNQIVTPDTGTDKTKFNADKDQFVLSERLLTLWIVWRWREMKRLDVTGDMENFSKAFDEIAARDAGSRVIRKGTHHVPYGQMAWPWELG